MRLWNAAFVARVVIEPTKKHALYKELIAAPPPFNSLSFLTQFRACVTKIFQLYLPEYELIFHENLQKDVFGEL